MVDRINNQKYYDYSKVNQQKRQAAEAAEFNLNTGKEGVIYEKEQKKKSAKPKEASLELEEQGTKDGRGLGVKLEISHKGYERSVREKQKISLIEEVKKYASLAVDFLKSVWDKVWNDNPGAKAEEFPEILEDKILEQEEIQETGLLNVGSIKFSEEKIEDNAKRKFSNQIAESIYTQEEIRQIFRRGNQKEIEDFLSNHGEKQLAKNTDLLTQYDRKGSIVGLNGSDKDLILHGSRNQIKL